MLALLKFLTRQMPTPAPPSVQFLIALDMRFGACVCMRINRHFITQVSPVRGLLNWHSSPAADFVPPALIDLNSRDEFSELLQRSHIRTTFAVPIAGECL
jgi:hypothetical protein